MGTVGFGSLNTQSDALEARQNSFVQQMQSGQMPTQDEKIDKSSKDFESMLLSSWLQQAEHSFATVPGSEDDGEDMQRDQMMSFGVQSLAGAMVANGGIGIAKMVAKAMHASADREHAAAEAAKSGEKTAKS